MRKIMRVNEVASPARASWGKVNAASGAITAGFIITHGLSLTEDPLAGVRGHAAIRGSHH